MFDFRRIVLALIVLAIAIPMVSAQEGPDNLPYNCRITSTPPLVRIEGVAELAGDVLISCSGIVPTQGIDPQTGLPRDLKGNVTFRADVPVTSQGISSSEINGRILTDALLINSGLQEGRCGADQFNCVPATPTAATTTGQIGQGAPYISGAPVFEFPMDVAVKNHGYWTPQDSLGATLEWDNVLLAPGSAAGKQWYMQLRITNVRINAAAYIGLADFAPAINAVITVNTQPGNVTAVPDTVVIARPRPSFRIESDPDTRRNCDDPKRVITELSIIELLPNAFKPRIDTEVNFAGCAAAGDQCNPNSAYFTESGLMLDSAWATTAPAVGNTGVATQGTQFNISVISPTTLDSASFAVSVGAGEDTQAGSDMTTTAGTQTSNSVSGNDRIRNFTITVDDFALDVDPFLTNRIRVPIIGDYEVENFGVSTLQVWYLPLSNAATESTVAIGAPVPRFVPSIKNAANWTVTRCRTLLLFPYVTNRNGYNTGIAIANTSQDTGPFAADDAGSSAAKGARPQTGPCTLFTYGGNNGPANPVAQTPVQSNINVPAGGMYLMTLQTGGVVKGPAGQDVGAVGAAAGFEGYIIASCEFQYAHGYAFISDVGVQRLAQGYLALIIPDRLVTSESNDFGREVGDRPPSPFALGSGALLGGEQLVH